MLKAQTIRNDHAEVFTFLGGNLEACASACHTPADARRDSLVFVSQPEQLSEALRREAAIIIVHRKIAQLVPSALGACCCFAVAAVPMAMAVLFKYFDR